MKKLIMSLVIMSGVFLSVSSAQAWVCRAEAADGGWGEGFHPAYLAQAQRSAIMYCRAASTVPYSCTIVGCM